MTLVPVSAQAQGYRVHQDIVDVRRDQRHLDDLYSRRRREAAHHDWRNVQRIDREIATVRRRMDRDRHDVRGDIRHLDDRSYRDHDGDGYRYHDR